MRHPPPLLPGSGAAQTIGFRKWFHAGLALACALLLSACATSPPLSSSQSQQLLHERETVLYAQDRWLLMGRIAVQSGEEGWNANLHWLQMSDAYDITLSAPFGQGAVHLLGDRHGVELILPDQPKQSATDPEALLKEHLGWWVPLTGLRYWVRGVPTPEGEQVMEWDGEGKVVSLQQAGWTIAYRRYTQVDGLLLPDKIFMDNKQFKVRLVIDRWELAKG